MNPWQDVRYGARMLWNSRAFALTAALTIALGIGATTSVFSVCDAMLWKPVPLPRMESLVMVLERVAENPREWRTAAPADVDDLRRGTTAFESFASWTWGMANIVGAGGSVMHTPNDPEPASSASRSVSPQPISLVSWASSRPWGARFKPARISLGASARSSSATGSGAGASEPTRPSPGARSG